MLYSTRFRLPVAALVAAAALPLVLRTGAAGDAVALAPIPDSYAAGDHMEMQRSPCACRGGSGDPEKNNARSFEIVDFLHPRWTEESLRDGVDFALAYAELPGLAADYYLLRVYASGRETLATLVDRDGNEAPFDAEFSVIEKRGRRSVLLYVDLGLAAPGDDDSTNQPVPTEDELDLVCGDDRWILVVWENDDGSIGWDGECCDGEC